MSDSDNEKKVVFVSYWTEKYKKAAERLKESLDRLGLKSDINEIQDNDWQANVRYKPTYILEMLKKHEDAYAVVWIDADGDVVQRPDVFFEIEEDLAVRFKPGRNDKVELLSGTMFVRRTENMMAAMEEWIEELSVAPQNLSCPEQRVLQDILPRLNISVHELDEPYCRILVGRGRTGAPPDSVIVHYQFSRETRYGRTPARHLYDKTQIAKPGKIVRPRVHKKPDDRRRKIRAANKVDMKRKKRRVERDIARSAPMPDSLKSARRRNRIKALRQQHVEAERNKAAVEKIIKAAATARNRRERLDRIHNQIAGQNKHIYVGGVKGHPPTPRQLSSALMAMSTVPKAEELEGELCDEPTVIVMGNSPTLDALPADVYEKYPTIGCNRGLRYKPHPADYLVIADREPYCQERDSGRLARAADRGCKILLATSIFDPSVLHRGPWNNFNRRGQPIPTFNAYLYNIGPRKKNWDYSDVARGAVKLPVNFTTFEAPVVSCQNVVGSMLQVAGILGATRIVCIGVEMKWENKANSHFYGNGSHYGAYMQTGSTDVIMAALRIVKKKAEENGIEIINISPKKRSPFARVFGTYDIREFCKESSGLPDRRAVQINKEMEARQKDDGIEDEQEVE